MPLTSGMRLGPYEIIAPLGAGGMGEVYRARDTRLERTVAIKVLPEHLSCNPDSKQRFEREARAISSLNHPHICTLYDVGSQDGIDFLVMEYLEGQTLADRLQKGALPLEQVLKIGIEIADALDKAHRQGIVHRDLKPGNIMLTKSGAKLMDFGLAKPAQAALIASASVGAPTLSNRLTVEGTFVGTFQYMAPEQLEGKDADVRSDIFAFGAVLYEMTTARPAFSGESKATLIAAILSSEPPLICSLQPVERLALERVVRTCLAKDPGRRFWCAHDLKLQLESIQNEIPEAMEPSLASRRIERLVWAIACAVLLISAVVLYFIRPALQARPIRFDVLPPEKAGFVTEVEEHNLAISPDGRVLAFVTDSGGQRRIWLRPLNKLAAQPLSGTEGAASPFWSPDSRYLGFFADGKLKKVPASGGTPQILCSVSGVAEAGSWGPNERILFTEFEGRDAIFVVFASGGEPTALLDSKAVAFGSFRWPYWLPDGKRFLFLSWDEKESPCIRAASIESPKGVCVLPVASRVEFAQGHLIYVRERALVAQPFDIGSLRATGEPVPLANRLPYFLTGWAPFSVSRDGVLAYQAGEISSRLTWVNRKGEILQTIGEAAPYNSINLSPDGHRLVAEVQDPEKFESDLWIYDLARGVSTRFTSQTGLESSPVWSPDAHQIAFAAHGNRPSNLMVKETGGGDSKLMVPDSGNFQFPSDWSRDGRFFAYSQFDTETHFDIWVLSLTDDGKPFPFLRTQFNEVTMKFAPDGRWVAFASDASGRLEVYLRSFPEGGDEVRVSASGGSEPQWRHDGKELFYFSGDGQLMAVPVVTGKTITVGKPVALFDLKAVGVFDIGPIKSGLFPIFDPSPDGQRFVTIVGGNRAALPITVVLDWKQELKQ